MLFSLAPGAMPDGYGEALLSLDDAKIHLRVDGDDEDGLIAALRDASIDLVEQYSKQFLGPRTGVTQRFEGFGCRMVLAMGPHDTIDVTGVAYVDSAGGDASLSDGDWRITVDGLLVPALNAAWPASYGPVTVTYDAGYAVGEAPGALMSAVRLFLGHLYQNREAVLSDGSEGEIPAGVRARCRSYRLPTI